MKKEFQKEIDRLCKLPQDEVDVEVRKLSKEKGEEWVTEMLQSLWKFLLEEEK